MREIIKRLRAAVEVCRRPDGVWPVAFMGDIEALCDFAEGALELLKGWLAQHGYNYALSDVEDTCDILGLDTMKVAEEWETARKERRGMDLAKCAREPGP